MMPHLFLLLLIALVSAGCVSPPVYGLRPTHPEPRLAAPLESSHFRAAFVRVDSRQPTLRWEPFPDEVDRKAGLPSHVSQVSYDLKILRAELGHPSRVIYERVGLPVPSHRVEEPLERSARYFWTVRARFELNGATRVTPWSRLRLGPSADSVVPSPLYFGLETPAE